MQRLKDEKTRNIQINRIGEDGAQEHEVDEFWG